ncbi:MAG: phasin family protein [Alphaproteobacteria bacterium]
MSNDSSTLPLFSNETFFSLMENYHGMPDAFQSLVDIHINNLRSMNEIHQSSFADISRLASRQQDVFSQIIASATTFANDSTEHTDPGTVFKVGADSLKRTYEHAMESVSEISALLRKSGLQTTSLIKDGALQSIDELQKIQKKLHGSVKS